MEHSHIKIAVEQQRPLSRELFRERGTENMLDKNRNMGRRFRSVPFTDLLFVLKDFNTEYLTFHAELVAVTIFRQYNFHNFQIKSCDCQDRRTDSTYPSFNGSGNNNLKHQHQEPHQ